MWCVIKNLKKHKQNLNELGLAQIGLSVCPSVFPSFRLSARLFLSSFETVSGSEVLLVIYKVAKLDAVAAFQFKPVHEALPCSLRSGAAGVAAGIAVDDATHPARLLIIHCKLNLNKY